MDREVPTVFEPWATLAWHRSDTEMEALMSSRPGDSPELSVSELQVMREALAECLDQLDPQDRFVLEAIWFERVTVRALADRMGLPKSTMFDRSQAAVSRLGTVAAAHPLLSSRYVA